MRGGTHPTGMHSCYPMGIVEGSAKNKRRKRSLEKLLPENTQTMTLIQNSS